MATHTPNLNLKKPAGTDYVLVGDLNGNMDIVDTTIGKLSELDTSAKTNLVAAINEANESGASAPYVGENGNWYEWDSATRQYVDTGIHAQGDKGDAAGFGTPTATAQGLDAGEAPTVTIAASGADIAKTFAFAFGIPKGDTGAAAGFGTPTAAVTGLDAGQSPTVTVQASGSDVAKVFGFNFGIPKGDQGEPGTGNNWYVGTAISGTSQTPSAYPTGIENAQVGDMYLNNGSLPDTGRAYRCTVGGDAVTARWVYACLLRGSDGSGVGDMLKSTYDSDSDGIVDDSEKLGGNLPSYYASVTDVQNAFDELEDSKLDDNGDGSDVTVAFTQASEKTNISSGEKLSVLFGKIAKWFSSFGTAAWCNVGAVENGVAEGLHASQHASDGVDPITVGTEENLPIFTGIDGVLQAIDPYVARYCLGVASNPNLLDNWYFVGASIVAPVGTKYFAIQPTPSTDDTTAVGTVENQPIPATLLNTNAASIVVGSTTYYVKTSACVQTGGFPINQRGKEIYFLVNSYSIDRWFIQGNGSIAVLEDKIRLESTSTIFCNLIQTLEGMYLTPGATYALSWKIAQKSGNFHLRAVQSNLAIGASEGAIDVRADTADQKLTFVWTGNLKYLQITICHDTNVVPGDYVEIEAIKLELGNKQTLAREENGVWVLNDPPPDYGQELAKCQRYFLPFHEIRCAANVWEGKLNAFIPTPVTMRETAVPGVLLTNAVYVGENTLINNGLHFSATYGGSTKNGVTIGANTPNGTPNTEGILAANGSISLEL